MILLAPIVIIILIAALRGKPLIWVGVAFLIWTGLAFVPEFFDAQALDDKLNGALVYFSMYGLLALPIGVICIIAGVIKVLTIKTPKSGKGECLAPPPHTTGHAGPHPAVRKAPSS